MRTSPAIRPISLRTALLLFAVPSALATLGLYVALPAIAAHLIGNGLLGMIPIVLVVAGLV